MNDGGTLWPVIVTNLLTLVALMISFWVAHQANVKRIGEAAEKFAAMETKLQMMYDWFRNTIIGSLRSKSDED